WTVGTATSGKYSILVYGSYPTAASFTTTSALAAATKPGASDSYRTESTYTGTFEAGNWAVSLAVSSGTASAVGRGRARYRIWASTDPTGQSSVRELTSGVNSTGILSALTSSSDTVITGTVALGALTLNGEYVFWQLEWEITTADTTSTTQVQITDRTYTG